jgi:hypothetical protein
MTMRARATVVLLLGFFLALNVADLFLTWELHVRSRAMIDEGNPVAAWVLRSAGWPGLAAYKGASVLLAGGATLALLARHPRAGRVVLVAECALLSGVVTYSSLLLNRAGVLGAGAAAVDEAILDRWQGLQQQIRQNKEFQALLQHWTRQLIARRCDLPEAVEHLLECDKRNDVLWMKLVRRTYSLESERDCFAAVLMAHATHSLKHNPALRARRAKEWAATYQAHFNLPSPAMWVRMTAAVGEPAI